MFYLNKYINTLIHKTKEQNEKPNTYALGFSIEPQEGEKVEDVGGLIPKAIVKLGSTYFYSVGYGINAMTKFEEEQAKAAKAKVIDILANGNDEISINLFDKALEIAKTELASKIEANRAAYISYMIAHDTVGYGPLSILFEDKQNLEEIEVNSPQAPIVVHHTVYGKCQTNLKFSSASWFRHFLNRLIYNTEKELNENTPIIDAQVENARVHAQIKPYALSGAAASIRFTNTKKVAADYLIRNKTASAEVLAYLWLAVDAEANIIIAGAPASGKTTLLSAISSFIPKYQRVVTIEEDVNELKIDYDINNTVALYGTRYNGTTTRDQVINALRMRPNRLIVGELRGSEAKELFSGANLGIPFMTTMHSNPGAIDVIKKLLIKPMAVDPKALSALDLVIYMRQTGIRSRLVESAYEYLWLNKAESESGMPINGENEVSTLTTVKNGMLEKSAMQGSKIIKMYAKKQGKSIKQALNELEKRTAFLSGVATKSPEDAIAEIQKRIMMG